MYKILICLLLIGVFGCAEATDTSLDIEPVSHESCPVVKVKALKCPSSTVLTILGNLVMVTNFEPSGEAYLSVLVPGSHTISGCPFIVNPDGSVVDEYVAPTATPHPTASPTPKPTVAPTPKPKCKED
jgi:hypothetical protein